MLLTHPSDDDLVQKPFPEARPPPPETVSLATLWSVSTPIKAVSIPICDVGMQLFLSVLCETGE